MQHARIKCMKRPVSHLLLPFLTAFLVPSGSIFNRGKVLAAMGEEATAQQSFRMALKLAEKVAPATWTKSFAAIKMPTDAEVKEMENAAASLADTAGVYSSTLKYKYFRLSPSLFSQSLLWLHAICRTR